VDGFFEKALKLSQKNNVLLSFSIYARCSKI